MKEPRLVIKKRYSFVENMTNDRYKTIGLLPQHPIVSAILSGEIKPEDICK